MACTCRVWLYLVLSIEPCLHTQLHKHDRNYRKVKTVTSYIFPGWGAFDHLKWTRDDGAFEQLFGPGRGGLKQKFSKNSNAREVAGGGGGKLRFDW